MANNSLKYLSIHFVFIFFAAILSIFLISKFVSVELQSFGKSTILFFSIVSTLLLLGIFYIFSNALKHSAGAILVSTVLKMLSSAIFFLVAFYQNPFIKENPYQSVILFFTAYFIYTIYTMFSALKLNKIYSK